MKDELTSQFMAWPKIDLHRHLEGSLRLSTLSEIARNHGIRLPGYEVETIRPLVQMTDDPRTYRHFLEKFQVLRHFYRSSEIIERVAYEAIEDAAKDNLRYLELRFTPTALAKEKEFSLMAVTEWVIKAVRKAEKNFDIQVGLILSLNRHEDIGIGEKILDLAVKYQDEIVGLDLAGDEAKFSAAPFASMFRRAKDMGFGVTVHAGEWNSAESIAQSIHYLAADRIGHGVRAIENRMILQLLKDRKITLEICPTSNLHSGAVGGPAQHPLAELIDLGVSITINTDDPSISGITLSDEYAFAVGKLGLSIENLQKTVLNAARAAFLPEREKAILIEKFTAELWIN